MTWRNSKQSNSNEDGARQKAKLKAWDDARSTASSGSTAKVVPVILGLPVRNKHSWRRGVVVRITRDDDVTISVAFHDGAESTIDVEKYETSPSGMQLRAPTEAAFAGGIPLEIGLRVQNKRTWRRGTVTGIDQYESGTFRVNLDFSGETTVEVEHYETQFGELLAEPVHNVVTSRRGLRVQNEKNGRLATVIDTKPMQPGSFLLRFDDGEEKIREITKFHSEAHETIADFIPREVDIAGMRPVFQVTVGLRVRHINTWRLATVVEVLDDVTENVKLRFNNGTEQQCQLPDYETCCGKSLAKRSPCLSQTATPEGDLKADVASYTQGAQKKKSQGKKKAADSLTPWPAITSAGEGQPWENSTGESRANRWKAWEAPEDDAEKVHPPTNSQHSGEFVDSDTTIVSAKKEVADGTHGSNTQEK